MVEDDLARARWIWTADGSPRGSQLAEFRRTFEVPATGCRLRLFVTADSRYRLWLNGSPVATGPCRGDADVLYFDTIEVSDQLRPGTNVLTARVVHYAASTPFRMGRDGPSSVWRSSLAGLLLGGVLLSPDDEVVERLETGEKWEARPDPGWSLVRGDRTLHVGDNELVDGRRRSEGDWASPSEIGAPVVGVWGELALSRPLEPRPIPMAFEREHDLLGDPVVVAPGQVQELTFDAGELTTAYLRAELVGGVDAELAIVCAERYDPEDPAELDRWPRDRPGVLVGDPDTYRPAGAGEPEVYEPFEYRTFRFLRLVIRAGADPVTLQRLSYRETGYPLEVIGSFECSDESLNAMWPISVRTLQRCMHDQYVDCPYYEQLQYAMDSRLEAIYTYLLSADDRLARKTIEDLRRSQLPNGLTQSRAPDVVGQVIPGFSLLWIGMIHDHFTHFGDRPFVQRLRPAIDAVLDWWNELLTPAGLTGAAPPTYWSFVDWSPQWRGQAGAPGSAVTIHSLMYSAALQEAATLNEATGRSGVAAEYRQRAETVNAAVREHCWSSDRRLFRDDPESEQYSQHAQVWAVLAHAVTDETATDLLERALVPDDKVAQLSYVMAYFAFRALRQVGRYDAGQHYWDRWRRFLELNVTTWPEEDFAPRSECHGWASVPLAEFGAEILGVQPAEPGYRRIRVEPQPGRLTWAKGVVATPRGPVQVSWQAGPAFAITVDGPPGIPIDVVLAGHDARSYETGGHCETSFPT